MGGLLISNKPFPIEDIETIRDMCEYLRVRFSIEISTVTRHLLNCFPASSDPIDIFSEKPLTTDKNK